MIALKLSLEQGAIDKQIAKIKFQIENLKPSIRNLQFETENGISRFSLHRV